MPTLIDTYANPTRFLRLTRIALPWLSGVTIICLTTGLYLAFFASPADYQQGESVRMMYVHVPSAWIALSSYLGLGVACLFFLVWRHPLADVAARAIAPVGAVFAFLTLATGSLWGRPMWGTWWVWDGRLTSMLVLLFFFIGYLALASGFERSQRGARPAAILALVGCINLPIVKFSVEWWNTLHQPASIMRGGGIAIDASMLWPLFTMFIGLQALFILLVLLQMQTALIMRRVARLSANKVGDSATHV